MNTRGMVFGVLIAVVAAVSAVVGFQLLVWGSTAPDWYVIPDLLFSGTAGFAGAHFGGRYL